jgi:M3 family oligoendopeptidase
MKFEQYTYERPNMNEIEQHFHHALKQMKEASTFQVHMEAIEEINQIRRDFNTMYTLCSIRYSIDTTNEFYKKEQDYLDEVSPQMEGLVSKYNEALVNSNYRKELEKKWGTHLFQLAECQLKTFTPEIIPLLQQENKLVTEYTELIASAKIMFEGEERTLAQLQPFVESPDRNMRKRAIEARFSFFAEHEEKLDQLYDDLVKVRTEIAHKLGFKNFIELGYLRLQRTDYDASMVKTYREQIKQHIVPLATELRKRQAKRIGVDELKFYDESFNFPSGNAQPKGDATWILQHGKTMYHELSKETKEFIDFLLDRHLMDVEAKKGKASGGYCTYIDNYQAPFIFSNFNGTSGDIDVLTHEAGHAFQVYSSRHFTVPEYLWPTLEACEIHSMSMEFFTWPWMHLFFEEDTDKYKFTHLTGALLFLPYGVAVDEFQHFVYEHYEASPEERKKKWRELEQTFLPHRDYDGMDYLERGGFWQRQGHIYSDPFYYIDYTLAQICALQFWKRSQENHDQAWEDYLHLCQLGGSLPFTELVKEAKLLSPFAEGCVASTIQPIREWLNQINDKAL